MVISKIRNAARVHIDFLRQDILYAIRTFLRAPGFALTIILVAGLGIGATTAVFTIADHVLLRPLPFPESDRLVKIWETSGDYMNEPSPPNYEDWKKMTRSFQQMGAFAETSMNLVGRNQPERLDGASLTSDVLPLLGVNPAFGRAFNKQDETAGAPGTVLISYSLWQSYFGADPSLLGSTVRLDDETYTVIGVMPRTFFFPRSNCEFWIPLRMSPDDAADRTNRFLKVVARLKRNVSLDRARQEMNVVAARLERAYPKENEHAGVLVNRMQDEISKRSRMLLTVLLSAAFCVLLIVCSNLANLLLARSKTREKEIALRASLGAGRQRILRQLLTESLLLSFIGGVSGILCAAFSLPLLIRLVPQSLPIGDPSLDFRVLIFALIITMLTGLGFGMIPSWRASRISEVDALREGQQSGIGGRKERFRSALVIVEVGVSVVLLVCAGLLIRALWNLELRDPGFNAKGVLSVRTTLPWPKYSSTAQRQQFYTRVLSEIRRMPNVQSAAYITGLPMVMVGGLWGVGIPGLASDPAAENIASLRFLTPAYFQTLGIPIRMGRDVSVSDTRESLPVAVVSESFVRKYLPKQNPLGKRFQFALQERTIVGVAGDIRVRGLERESEPQVYLPSTQVPDASLIGYTPKDLVVRVSGNPMALVPDIRRIVLSADPEQPISDIRTLEEIVSEDTSSRQTQAQVLGAFATLAILLAGIGIHGVLSFSVSQRTQEIGVRAALGATRSNILGMVMKEGVILAVAGVLVGVLVAFVAGRAMQSLLIGVAPDDAQIFSIAICAATIMTLMGSLIPAMRATRIDPASALRAE